MAYRCHSQSHHSARLISVRNSISNWVLEATRNETVAFISCHRCSDSFLVIIIPYPSLQEKNVTMLCVCVFIFSRLDSAAECGKLENHDKTQTPLTETWALTSFLIRLFGLVSSFWNDGSSRWFCTRQSAGCCLKLSRSTHVHELREITARIAGSHCYYALSSEKQTVLEWHRIASVQVKSDFCTPYLPKTNNLRLFKLLLASLVRRMRLKWRVRIVAKQAKCTR